MTSHRDSGDHVSPRHSSAAHGTPLTFRVMLRWDPDLSPPGFTNGSHSPQPTPRTSGPPRPSPRPTHRDNGRHPVVRRLAVSDGSQRLYEALRRLNRDGSRCPDHLVRRQSCGRSPAHDRLVLA